MNLKENMGRWMGRIGEKNGKIKTLFVFNFKNLKTIFLICVLHHTSNNYIDGK